MNIRSTDNRHPYLLQNSGKHNSLIMQMVKSRLSQKKSQQAERQLVVQTRGSHADQKGKGKKRYLTEEEMKIINESFILYGGSSGVYKCGDLSFTLDQIPDLDMSKLREVRAEKNVLDFGESGMFKFKAGSGKEYAVYVHETGISSPWTETLRQSASQERFRYITFWNWMLGDTVYMQGDSSYLPMQYTKQEIKQYLEDAGIEYGFFTVKMGNHEAVQYYSKGMISVYTKERYDEQYYAMCTLKTHFRNYEPGSIFKIGDKEYVLREDHTLDIPYGEDIFAIEYPKWQ